MYDDDHNNNNIIIIIRVIFYNNRTAVKRRALFSEARASTEIGRCDGSSLEISGIGAPVVIINGVVSFAVYLLHRTPDSPARADRFRRLRTEFVPGNQNPSSPSDLFLSRRNPSPKSITPSPDGTFSDSVFLKIIITLILWREFWSQ